MTGLLPCPLCAGVAREIPAPDLHVSFCLYDDDNNVEHNFLHFGGSQCVTCGLLLPFHDLEENRDDNIAFWNQDRAPAEPEPMPCLHERTASRLDGSTYCTLCGETLPP